MIKNIFLLLLTFSFGCGRKCETFEGYKQAIAVLEFIADSDDAVRKEYLQRPSLVAGIEHNQMPVGDISVLDCIFDDRVFHITVQINGEVGEFLFSIKQETSEVLKIIRVDTL
ncbi:MAG: hypothetical protein ACPGN3_13770 [Opitutales bacterium]